jgi:hypothetical protein
MAYQREDTVVPDTKNWTWVLERPCPQCGLDTRTVEPTEIAGMLGAAAAAFAGVLQGGGDVRTRPRPGVWSPLEYGCHVRDVFAVFSERIRLMLVEDDPLFPDWDQDRTAVQQRYGKQDPGTVAGQLRTNAKSLATCLDGVHGSQWSRPGRRADGSVFTVASLSRYLLHDPVHHLYDVTGTRHLR